MNPAAISLPDSLRDVAHLEDVLSAPPAAVVESIARTTGDYLILGVGGKMGPTLARMLHRALDAAAGGSAGGSSRRVIGVSRFREGGLEARLRSWGIETIACDLLVPVSLARLPDAPNIVYMAGMKFGATGNEPLTWAMNTYLPGMVTQRFRHSRIVAFSTGNVYGLIPAPPLPHSALSTQDSALPLAQDSGLLLRGSRESDPPNPVGEYAMSCLGRERIFQHFGTALNVPIALIRLNYAVEPRYGILVDIAQRILAGHPVDVSMGHVNLIWQGDANAQTLRCFGHAAAPPFLINVTGPEALSVRALAEQLATLLDRPLRISGTEAPTALLSNATRARDLFGPPTVPLDHLLHWTADWLRRDQPTLNKPTHFDSRDGKF